MGLHHLSGEVELGLGREQAIAPGAVKVLRTFLYHENGVRRRVQVGEVLASVPPGVLPGLIREGFVQPGAAVSEPEPAARAKKK